MKKANVVMMKMTMLFEQVVIVIIIRELQCRRRCVLKLKIKQEMLINIFFSYFLFSNN